MKNLKNKIKSLLEKNNSEKGKMEKLIDEKLSIQDLAYIEEAMEKLNKTGFDHYITNIEKDEKSMSLDSGKYKIRLVYTGETKFEIK